MVLFRSQGNGNLFVGSTSPSGQFNIGDLWDDTSVSPPLLKVWDGSSWSNPVAGNTTITVAGIQDTLEDYILEL